MNFLGIFNFTVLNPSPYGAGRAFSSLLNSLLLSHFNQVSEFIYLRLISSFFWSLSGVFIYFGARRLFYSKFSSILFSILILVIPGTLFLSVMGLTASYSIIFFLLVLFSYSMIRFQFKNKIHLFIFILVIFVLGQGYQPLNSIILFFPLLHWLHDRKENIIAMRIGLFSFFFSLLSNYLLVRVFYDNTRAIGSINFFDKMELLQNKILPMTVVPQVYVHSRQFAVTLCSLIVFLVFITV